MDKGGPLLRIFPGPEGLARGAAEEFRRRARRAVERNGRFAVALSGGSTPGLLYRELAGGSAGGAGRPAVSWDRTHCFWGDERWVPADHPDSNAGSARAGLLSRVPIPAEQVHPIPAGAGDPQESARRYERTLREFFGLPEGKIPVFDLILLGMGEDGHTASLFPGSEAVRETRRLVTATWVEKLRAHRISLTFPVINRADCVIFLVSGKSKAGVLREVLESDRMPDRFPAQAVRPGSGKLLWFVDEPAAGGLAPETRRKESSPGSTRGSEGGIVS